MVDITNVIHKIKLLGGTVLTYNPFSIIYSKDGILRLLRYYIKDNKIIRKEESGFKKYDISKHFVLVTYYTEDVGLYTLYSESTIAPRSKQIFVYSCDNKTNKCKYILQGDSEVILYINDADTLYMVNYKGERINILDYNRRSSFDIIGILYNVEYKKYQIGYGKYHVENTQSKQSKGEKRIVSTLDRLDIVGVVTDKDFKDIEFSIDFDSASIKK